MAFFENFPSFSVFCIFKYEMKFGRKYMLSQLSFFECLNLFIIICLGNIIHLYFKKLLKEMHLLLFRNLSVITDWRDLESLYIEFTFSYDLHCHTF